MQVLKHIVVPASCLVLGYFFGANFGGNHPESNQEISSSQAVVDQDKASYKPIAITSPSDLAKLVRDDGQISTIDKAKLGLKLAQGSELEVQEFSQLSDFVDGLAEDTVERGLGLFFSNTHDLENIEDKRAFASNLIRELSSEDTDIHEQSQAQIYFSLDPGYPDQPEFSLSLEGKEKVYAHIDLQGGLGLGDSQLYVRWKNLQTREVLLFTNKEVDPSSQRHWISFTPGNDWENHPYEVTFYRFNAGLDKLASAQYSVIVSPE